MFKKFVDRGGFKKRKEYFGDASDYDSFDLDSFDASDDEYDNGSVDGPIYYSSKYKYKSNIEDQMHYLQSSYSHIRSWRVKEVHGEWVIEVFCSYPDEEFVVGVLRQYFPNRIEVFYV